MFLNKHVVLKNKVMFLRRYENTEKYCLSYLSFEKQSVLILGMSEHC